MTKHIFWDLGDSDDAASGAVATATGTWLFDMVEDGNSIKLDCLAVNATDKAQLPPIHEGWTILENNTSLGITLRFPDFDAASRYAASICRLLVCVADNMPPHAQLLLVIGHCLMQWADAGELPPT
jgi:hypothetical protein